MGDVEEMAAKPLRWFPHDADAASDPKCRRLVRSLGAAGYGRYWMLCEALASEPGHALPVRTDLDWENLAVTLDLEDGREAAGFLAELESLGLVDVEGGLAWSRRMGENARWFGSKRAAGRRGGAAKASSARAVP